MMTTQDYWTLYAMQERGGSFVKALAELAWHADPANMKKIRQAWRAYWNEYEALGRELQKKELLP